MKINFKNILLMVFLMVFCIPIYAMIQDGGGDNPLASASIVEMLTPLVVLGATYLIRLAAPLIPAWATMLVVSVLSAAVAWISAQVLEVDGMSFIVQTLYGLLAVILNQFYRAFAGGGNATFARSK